MTGGLLGGVGGGVADAADTVADAASNVPDAVSSARDKMGDIVNDVRQGKSIAQAPAQAAVRQAAEASANNLGTASGDIVDQIRNAPVLKDGGTFIDDHLAALQNAEKSAYQQVDDTVGFDLKAEKQQLANDQYKLSQLGNTDQDITQRGNLIEAINDSQQRIADAGQKLQDAGIDPRVADTLHQQVKAGQDFQKMVQGTFTDDGQAVNIDRLLAKSQALRYSKYGDRLEQFFGSEDAANTYMNQLRAAQQQGVHALKVQGIAKILGKLGIGAIGLGALGHAASVLIGH